VKGSDVGGARGVRRLIAPRPPRAAASSRSRRGRGRGAHRRERDAGGAAGCDDSAIAALGMNPC
jgi:hypothetical protein